MPKPGSMEALTVTTSSGEPDRLVLMLPGAHMRAADFAAHGFGDALGARGWPIDALGVDADLGVYLDRTIAQRLHRQIVTPARARGYVRIWVLGISLGGLGALSYAQAYPQDVQGVILLAPFLGTTGLIAEVTRAGSLAQWSPGDIASDPERAFLAWLQRSTWNVAGRPALQLGYGRADRFAPASVLLSAKLAASQIALDEGGHDWATWKRLWAKMMDMDLFGFAG
jgi:pimeloyl-ACP methyl ester carboxylesterase